MISKLKRCPVCLAVLVILLAAWSAVVSMVLGWRRDRGAGDKRW